MKVAYARVSSVGQNLDSQIASLKEYGCEKFFQETASGTSTKGRDKLKECLEFVREGDELVITRVDRAARSVLDLQLIVKELTDKGVTLTATEQPISTKDATSKCFLDMLSVFSEFETNLRKERQKVGIERIKQLGLKYGGNDFISDEIKQKIIDLKKNGLSYRKIKEKIEGVSLGSISNIIKENSLNEVT